MKVLPILLTLTLSAYAYGQDQPTPGPKRARTPEDYTLRTLKQVSAKLSPDKIQGGTNQAITRGDVFPSRVRATFAGCLRPISQGKQDVLQRWAQLYAGAPEHYTVPYDREMLFDEGGRHYWLAVKRQMAGELAKALKMGQAVDLFLVRLGGVRSGDEWQPLLLVEGFKTVE